MSTIFEKIVQREIPAKIIYEDEDVLAFLDISQITAGHTLVIPKKHTESILTSDPETVAKVNVIAQKLAIQLVEILNAQGVNILSNANAVAGQTVHHYHVHIIPRYSEDELRLVPQAHSVDLEMIFQKIQEKKSAF